MTVTADAISLEAKNIYKRYGQRNVVHDISISIRRGEIVGILGPNGAGKTTTFYMLVGLVDPDQGSILINDRDITNLPIHKRARQGLAYLPQEASVFRNLTVYENVMAILQLRKDLNSAARKEKCQALLEEFHLDHLSKSNGISLSGGERRRLEIARALANDPAFLLLDEPFAGVDPISVIDLKKIIRTLSSKNIGVLITDHNVRETLDISERAYIVHAGEIFASGTPKQILENKEVQRVYLGENFK